LRSLNYLSEYPTLAKRTQVGVSIAALLIGLVGVVNLLSTVTPSLSEQVAWLQEIFPFQVRAGGYLLAAITGFILLTLETNLLRRKRVAWLLTISLLIVFIISNSLKGFDYEESLLAAVLLVQLLFMRGAFVAASDRPSIAQGVRVLIGALLFTLAYGTAGFFLLNQQFTVNFTLPGALIQNQAMFFTADNAGWSQPRSMGAFLPIPFTWWVQLRFCMP